MHNTRALELGRLNGMQPSSLRILIFTPVRLHVYQVKMAATSKLNQLVTIKTNFFFRPFLTQKCKQAEKGAAVTPEDTFGVKARTTTKGNRAPVSVNT